jgi:hypothetical protein
MYMNRYHPPNTRRHKLVQLPKLHDGLAVLVIPSFLDTQRPDHVHMHIAYLFFFFLFPLSCSSNVVPFFYFWHFFVRIWTRRPSSLSLSLSMIVPAVMTLSVVVAMTMPSTSPSAHWSRASVVATIIIAATVITRALV